MSSDEIMYIKKYKKQKYFILFIQLLIVLIFICIWQYLSNNKIINSFMFSSPSRIVNTIINLNTNKILLTNIFTTLKEIIIAFSLGFSISFIIALVLYLSNNLYKIVDPFLSILNSLPKVALGPLLIILFKANTNSIIIMALLINVFVCIQTLYIGFINCNKYYLLLFKSYNASKYQTLMHLIIPSAYSNIVSALKLNISMTMIGVIMGEFLVSKSGIGYLIIYGTQVFNMDLVYASILILIILSYLLYIPIKSLENKIKTMS